MLPSDAFFVDNFGFFICYINDWLRDILKYNSEKNSEDALEAFEKTRKEIFSLMEKWNVTYEL